MRNRYVHLKGSKLFSGRAYFVRYFIGGKKLKLLDVGNLGDGGPHTNTIRAMVEESGGTYVGLDVNENLGKELGYKHQITGDLHDLSGVVADETFDCVYAGEIIEHSWHPGDMIRECARILKPDGLLLIDTPNVYDLGEVLRVYFKGINTMGDLPELTHTEAKDNFARARAEEGALYTQPQHKVFYGPASLRQLLNMHGFAIEEIAYIDKSQKLWQRLAVQLVPQAAQKIGVAARKKDLDAIFMNPQFGDA